MGKIQVVFEELVESVPGKKGSEEGSLRLVKAHMSAQIYVKMGFAVEKMLLDQWKSSPREDR